MQAKLLYDTNAAKENAVKKVFKGRAKCKSCRMVMKQRQLTFNQVFRDI